MLRLTYPPCPVMIRLLYHSFHSLSHYFLAIASPSLFLYPSIFWLHYFLVLYAFRQYLLSLFTLLLTNSFLCFACLSLTFSLFHFPTILLSLYFLAFASLMLRLTYPPCPVILSLLFHSFTPLSHYFANPLFSGYRLTLCFAYF